MRYSIKPMTAFVFAAIMSMIVAKFFCDLALADADIPQPTFALDDSSDFLGVYEVADIKLKARYYKGSICKEHLELGQVAQPERDCGLRIWVIRRREGEESSLAFIKADENGRWYESFLFSGDDCKPVVRAKRDGNPFDSGLCHAEKSRRATKRGLETYLSSEEFGLFIPGSEVRVRLPKTEDAPASISAEESISGSMVLVGAHPEKTYQLTRLSE